MKGKRKNSSLGFMVCLSLACCFVVFLKGCEIFEPDIFRLSSLGDYQYQLEVNLLDYSNIAIDNAYVIGWENNWDNLIPMDIAPKEGWVEIVLNAPEESIQSFAITNESKTQWLWIDIIDHPLAIPSVWLDPDANPDDKILAFLVDTPDSYQYLTGITETATTTIAPEVAYLEPREVEIGKNTEFNLSVEVGLVENIFGVGFDLNFDDQFLEYIDVAEADLLSSDCQTVMMTDTRTPGKVIFGLTRLSNSCGSVSGPGTIATFRFKSRSQSGLIEVSFSHNLFCILKPGESQYDFSPEGSWTKALVAIQ